MADLDLEWGADLVLSPAGDLNMVEGDDMVRQHICRRLFTAVKGYTFHLEYGAGLPQRIGRVARAREIQALVRANIGLETTVARLPVPKVSVAEDETVFGLFNIQIDYFNVATGAPVALSFEVPTN